MAAGTVVVLHRPGGPVVVPDDAYATPADPGLLVDLPTAQRVFSALWPLRINARNDHDVDAFRLIETGPARDFDPATCLAGCDDHQFPDVRRVEYTAAPQRQYPVAFLAQAVVPCLCHGTNGVPIRAVDTEFAVFTRQRASEPWKIAFVTGVADEQHYLRDTDAASMARPAPEVRGIGATQLPSDLATYWATVKQTNQPPAATPFSTTGALKTRLDAMVKAGQRWHDEGIDDTVSYRSGVDEDGVFNFATADGHLFQCATVRWSGSFTPTTSKGIVVGDDDRKYYGFIVDSGTYRSIKYDGVRSSCFDVDPTCACVEVVGAVGGDYAVETQPG